jgi:DNA-binding response OmpR family regulator
MPERLLIVDDEPAVRLPLEAFFTGKGFEVLTAPTGAQAFEVFRSSGPDLVLLDYALPDGDGLDVLRRMRSTTLTCPSFCSLPTGRSTSRYKP